MWVVSGSGVPIDSFTARDASAYNAQNRRVDVGYDAAGNQTAIGGYTWAYDAEGHLKTSTINGATATYYYDAEGRRVKRVLPVGTTVYVYDAGGNPAAEYGYAEPGAPCTTCYLTADHLGSTRMLVDGTGALKSLHDYLPFGEEVQAGVGGRSSTAYVSQPLAINDGTTIKFTGKEREGENAAWLDYFGARYYASVQGRFTSPDVVNALPEKVVDPQQWNLYVYGRGNPLKYVDPSGQRIVVYTELGGTSLSMGHAFIHIQNDAHNVIFSYGRYAAGSSNINARGLNPIGDGVLIRIEGDANVNSFLADRRAKDATLLGNSVAVRDEEAVFKYLQDKFDRGQSLDERQATIVSKSNIDPRTARVIDTYFLLWTNCTTLTWGALKAGGSDMSWSFAPQMMRTLLENRMPPMYSSYGDRVPERVIEDAKQICIASGGMNPSACGTAKGK